MDFFKKYNLSPLNILKLAGLLIIVIVVVALAARLVFSSFNSIYQSSRSTLKSQDVYEMMEAEFGGEVFTSAGESVGLSLRNIAPTTIPSIGGTTGDSAEDYEVKDYNVNIETRHLEKTCTALGDLKKHDYVVFENSNQYDKGCNYSFKVKKDKTEEVLKVIEELDPKDFSENVHTIKRLVDDYTGEIEILENKLETIEDTLLDAVRSYDEITKLATGSRDVENLAKIIESKLRIIERLTQEKININSTLDRLHRAKADQLDRLDYVFFNVTVYEDKFIDGEQIGDSWKRQVKEFVVDINTVAQDITINLVALLFFLIQYLLYFFILLIIAKYVYKMVKRIWKQ